MSDDPNIALTKWKWTVVCWTIVICVFLLSSILA